MFDMKCDGASFGAEVCTGVKIALHKCPHNLFHSYLSIPSLPPGPCSSQTMELPSLSVSQFLLLLLS